MNACSACDSVTLDDPGAHLARAAVALVAQLDSAVPSTAPKPAAERDRAVKMASFRRDGQKK